MSTHGPDVATWANTVGAWPVQEHPVYQPAPRPWAPPPPEPPLDIDLLAAKVAEMLRPLVPLSVVPVPSRPEVAPVAADTLARVWVAVAIRTTVVLKSLSTAPITGGKAGIFDRLNNRGQSEEESFAVDVIGCHASRDRCEEAAALWLSLNPGEAQVIYQDIAYGVDPAIPSRGPAPVPDIRCRDCGGACDLTGLCQACRQKMWDANKLIDNGSAE